MAIAVEWRGSEQVADTAGTAGAGASAGGVGLAIAAFVFALTCGALQGGLTKLMTGELPVLEVIWGRYVGLFAIVVPYALLRYGRKAVTPARPWLHILRALFLLMASVTFVTATSRMPLADTMAIVYVFPFIVTGLSPFLLGERVSRASWIAVATGFLGVLVVVRPGFQAVSIYVLLAVCTGLCYAFFLILSRRLSVAAPPTVTATWASAVGLILLSMTMPFVWVMPDARQILILAIVGGLAAISQIFTMYACAKVEMPVLAPFGYSDIVAATIIGLILFGDLPDTATWTGIAIIIASGVTIAIASGGRRIPLMSRSRRPGS